MLQIIGTKKCKDTAKAIRACKERKIDFQFVNLDEKELSEGEWNNIFQHYDGDSLIDTNSKLYKKKGFQYMEYDAVEELKENPSLLKTPILRSKKRVNCGFDLTIIEKWGEK